MDRALKHYEQAFTRLRANTQGGHPSPHKPVMLLAALSLADNGRLATNRIEYDPELLELFREYFDVVRQGNDECNPLLPFFHLRSSGFWHHIAVSGQEAVCEALGGPGGAARLRAVVSHVALAPELFALLAQTDAREILRLALIDRYFPDHRAALLSLSQDEADIGLYRQELVRPKTAAEKLPKPDECGVHVHRSAFRRVVTEAYDYRCAACGMRVIMDDLVLVEAAHLIPFSESQDDDPRNGMALCKNHHWAMDRFLIAPGPDQCWHVSRLLDDRLEGQRDLLDLASRSLLLPKQQSHHPRQDALEWRIEHLRKTA